MLESGHSAIAVARLVQYFHERNHQNTGENMFEGGSNENPAVYEFHLLGDSTTLGYLEIVQDDPNLTIQAESNIGWPLEFAANQSLVFERVNDAPSGSFQDQGSAELGWSGWTHSFSQIPDGGFEIGKHGQNGWTQIGLAFMDGYPAQRNLIGLDEAGFPIASSVGDRFRLSHRADITDDTSLQSALDTDFGANEWSGYTFAEDYD